MPSDRRVTCKVCGRHTSECGPISWRGKCGFCAERLQAENIAGMGLKTGYPFRRWRHAMAASVGGVLLDELPPKA